MDITFVTSAPTDKEAKALLMAFGLPFKKVINMAKESMKAREVKRAKLAAKYAAKRQSLKEAGDYEGLQKLPKNASPVRGRNRGCKLTGRPRGYMRQFGISRVTFREMANKGLIPEVRKATGNLEELEIMYTDPIADFLTRIRNGQRAGLRVVEVPSSKTKSSNGWNPLRIKVMFTILKY